MRRGGRHTGTRSAHHPFSGCVCCVRRPDYAGNTSNLSYCQAHNQPLSAFSTDLQSAATTPDFAWFAADDYNDMEQGGVAPGDSWLSSELPDTFNSPAWKTQNSLLIVTWDEGCTKAYGSGYPNIVPAYLVASQGQIRKGSTSSRYYDDYSLTATIEHALGLAPVNANDTYAQPVSDIWTGAGAGNGWQVPLASPDAESGACSSSGSGSPATVTGWTAGSIPQQVCYGAAGFPTQEQGPQAPEGPGSAFFGGGDSASATMTQTVDVCRLRRRHRHDARLIRAPRRVKPVIRHFSGSPAGRAVLALESR